VSISVHQWLKQQSQQRRLTEARKLAPAGRDVLMAEKFNHAKAQKNAKNE
jgi:hypothetical protein